MNLALIYDSTRQGRLCDRVAEWAGAEICNRNEFRLHPVDLATSALDTLQPRLKAADAFVAVTPEYNHSYPAALKALVDGVCDAWQAKPIAFVSYGGYSGGLRAVEHLRLVFAELHAVTIRDSVALPNIWDRCDARSGLNASERSRHAMTKMLVQLKWWARALREARTAVPYQRAVA